MTNPLTYRSLTLTVAVAVALMVGGCSGTSTKRAALPPPVRVVEGDLKGARVALEMQPLVRAGSLTVMTAVIKVIKTGDYGPLNIRGDFAFKPERNLVERNLVYDLSDVRLFVPDGGLLASPAKSSDGSYATTWTNQGELAVGESAGLRVVYGALPPGVRRADALWPFLGVVPDLPVVDGAVPPLPPFGASKPRDVKLAGVVGEVQPLVARSSQLEGAVRTLQAPAQTQVLLASDVLFALDRADLSPRANAALDAAAATIKATGPGPVKVTGYTDNQGTDEHNLDLSNRRAQSVAAALAPRLAPGSYPLEVSGRGKADPTDPAELPDSGRARAARRVELVVERPEQAAPAPASTALPAGGGPTAKGSDGLPFDQTPYTLPSTLPAGGGPTTKRSDGLPSAGSPYKRQRLRAEKAVDEGNWLRVDLSLTSEDPRVDTQVFIKLDDTLRPEVANQEDAAGVGVLDGGVLFLPAVERSEHRPQLEWPAVDPNGLCACPDVTGHIIYPLQQLRFSIWVAALPKLGATVDVQLPQAQGRLLDVPVAPK